MIFLETEKLNLCAPSKDNVQQWTNWVNSSFAGILYLISKHQKL